MQKQSILVQKALKTMSNLIEAKADNFVFSKTVYLIPYNLYYFL